jgi:hypothetical protein
MDTNNNIFFTVEDKPDNDGTTKLTDIDKMMDELLNDGCDDEDLDFDYSFDYGFDYGFDNIEKKTSTSSSSSSSSSSSTLAYFDEKKLYIGVPDSYYEAHTIKELMKICEYYDLAKNVKNAKCKKQDIVATVVFFEAQPENREIVNKRNKMWAYMREVANDQKMKPYLIWT